MDNIVYENTTLPGAYTIWGEVTEGLDLVRAGAVEAGEVREVGRPEGLGDPAEETQAAGRSESEGKAGARHQLVEATAIGEGLFGQDAGADPDAGGVDQALDEGQRRGRDPGASPHRESTDTAAHYAHARGPGGLGPPHQQHLAQKTDPLTSNTYRIYVKEHWKLYFKCLFDGDVYDKAAANDGSGSWRKGFNSLTIKVDQLTGKSI